jgi:hypothetical protein
MPPRFRKAILLPLLHPSIVTDGDETFDPITDQVIVIGRSGITSEEPSVLTDPHSVVINGRRDPKLVWKAGERHRLRLTNITPDDIFDVALQTSAGPVQWRPVAKDGAPLPPAESSLTPARQTIAVGRPTTSSTRRRQAAGPPGRKCARGARKWQAQARVVMK